MQDLWYQGDLLFDFLPFHRISQLESRDIFCGAFHLTAGPAALVPVSGASPRWGRQASTTGGQEHLGLVAAFGMAQSGPAVDFS